jgi:hypothetical protein
MRKIIFVAAVTGLGLIILALALIDHRGPFIIFPVVMVTSLNILVTLTAGGIYSKDTTAMGVPHVDPGGLPGATGDPSNPPPYVMATLNTALSAATRDPHTRATALSNNKDLHDILLALAANHPPTETYEADVRAAVDKGVVRGAHLAKEDRIIYNRGRIPHHTKALLLGHKGQSPQDDVTRYVAYVVYWVNRSRKRKRERFLRQLEKRAIPASVPARDNGEDHGDMSTTAPQGTDASSSG